LEPGIKNQESRGLNQEPRLETNVRSKKPWA